jgi:hypothetical protein
VNQTLNLQRRKVGYHVDQMQMRESHQGVGVEIERGCRGGGEKGCEFGVRGGVWGY